MRSPANEFTKGLWEQLPPLRLVLGLCPVLAVTITLEGGLGMGLATTFVLVMSNLVVSLLRHVIPPDVRVPSFIVIIAGFVVVTEMVMAAHVPLLADTLGVFLPLIVVNCIILGRAEAFAFANGPGRSLLDGLGIGCGFTLSLAVLGGLRELLGTGAVTLFSEAGLGVRLIPLASGSEYLFRFMVEPSGAFVCLGAMLLVVNLIDQRAARGVRGGSG